MDPSRILIRADGSREIGLGHVYRMRRLAVALTARGDRVLVVARRDETTSRLLADAGVTLQLFDDENRLDVLSKATRAQQPEAAVFDVLATRRDELALVRDHGVPFVLTIDDSGAGPELADVVVNAQVAMWQDRGTPGPARRLNGPEYMILDPRVHELRKPSWTAAPLAERVVVAMGGTDTHHVSERIVEALDEVPGPLDVRVNLGPGTQHTPGLRRALGASRHHAQFLHAPDDLLSVLVQADLVICAGGVMLYELAALGVPSACVSAEPHETRNASFFDERGTTLHLGWERTLEVPAAGERIGALVADRTAREAMHRAGRQVVDGRGLERTIAILDAADAARGNPEGAHAEARQGV